VCWAASISSCTCSSMAQQRSRAWHEGTEAVGNQVVGHGQCGLQHFTPLKSWRAAEPPHPCRMPRTSIPSPTPALPSPLPSHLLHQPLEPGCYKLFWHFTEAGIHLRVQKRKAGRQGPGRDPGGVRPGQGQVGVLGFPVPPVDFQGLSGD